MKSAAQRATIDAATAGEAGIVCGLEEDAEEGIVTSADGSG